MNGKNDVLEKAGYQSRKRGPGRGMRSQAGQGKRGPALAFLSSERKRWMDDNMDEGNGWTINDLATKNLLFFFSPILLASSHKRLLFIDKASGAKAVFTPPLQDSSTARLVHCETPLLLPPLLPFLSPAYGVLSRDNTPPHPLFRHLPTQ